MAERSWPSPNHESGSVDDGEYERLATPPMVSGLTHATPASQPLVYADSSGRSVKLRANRYAQVRGRTWYSGSSDVTVTIAANSSGNPRIDLVVLRLDRATYDVRAAVLQGTPAASPAAPATTNDTTASTGVWELPLARVAVPNGVTTIAAGAVTPVAWYVSADGSVLCTSTTRPSTTFTGNGVKMLEHDTGRVRISIGGSWVRLYDDTGWVSYPAASGWTQVSSGLRYRVRNGLATVNCHVQRSGSSLPAAQSADSVLGTLPAEARPDPYAIRILGYIDSAYLAMGHIMPDGRVILTDYWQHGVGTGEKVQFGTVTYPIGS